MHREAAAMVWLCAATAALAPRWSRAASPRKGAGGRLAARTNTIPRTVHAFRTRTAALTHGGPAAQPGVTVTATFVVRQIHSIQGGARLDVRIYKNGVLLGDAEIASIRWNF